MARTEPCPEGLSRRPPPDAGRIFSDCYPATADCVATTASVVWSRLTASGRPEVIQLSAGQHIGLSAWTIGAPLEQVRVRLRLITPEGSGLANQQVSLLDVTNPEVPDFIQHVMGSRTTAEGRVEFDARVGRSYVIVRGHRLTSEVARTNVFTPSKGLPELTLVLSQLRKSPIGKASPGPGDPVVLE